MSASFSKIMLIITITIAAKTSVLSQNVVDSGMRLIKGGTYIPLYGVNDLTVKVDSFYMDIYPITNKDFKDFLVENSSWRRSNIKRIFTDSNYLINWKNDLSPSETTNLNAAVTNVSWFAAKKYCECQGKRLPLLDEWEYTAMANQTLQDARTDENYNQYILNWYESPKSFNKSIGSTFKNYWGIYDLHGLVWEWTMDFNSVLISGESRKDVDKDSDLFCGSAAIGSTDLMNYAAFMRYAFRGSLKARYAVKNLGFRCAKDISPL